MARNFNPSALLYLPYVKFINKSLAIPHFSVKSINNIDPEKLNAYGCKGLIFDKDNTLTTPYTNELHPEIQDSFLLYQAIFGKNMVILSNYAGTNDDKDKRAAKEIEDVIGIKVIRHHKKKPAGIEPVIDYFKCDPKELVMFGDMVMTDIVFGNRYGMLTVYTAPLTNEGDVLATKKGRIYAHSLMVKWSLAGIQAPAHCLYHEDICLERLVSALKQEDV